MEVKEIKPLFIIDKNGKKTYVVLPFTDYEELLEDHNDLVVMTARKDEPRISFDKFEENLKKDGLI